MKAAASPGRQTYARCRRFASYLAGRGIGTRRHGRGDAAEYPRDERAAFCGADGRRGAERAQHPARCALDRVPARSWRRQDHPGRSGIFRRDRGSADADEGPKAVRHRRRRCGLCRRKADRRNRIRGGGGAGRSGLRGTTAGRRMGRHCAELHLGHHGQSEGRGDPSPRRLSQRRQQYPRRQSRPASGLSLDAADVPLQRLVLSLDHRGRRRRQCLPAQGRSDQNLRADREARRHPHVRRADRLQHADQRAGRAEGARRAAGGRTDRRRSAAGRRARRRRKHRHQADACLWPDRGLWPRLGLRRAAGLGRTAGRSARAAEAPAGRALPAARKPSPCSIPKPCARCRATARPSAR